MSETLPSQQNESQAWKRELPLHRELAGTLKPEETLALMGSWTERNLADQYEIYEPGTKERTRQEAVYGAALEQLAELRGEEGDSMGDVMEVLYSRQRELKDALRRSDNQAENIRIGEQLAGIKLLDDIRFMVTDQVDLGAEVIGSKSSPRDKAAAINEMIAEHNEWVSRGSETIADSPEMREAQERINDRYAKQAKQPQLTETVDDARQKVVEAFGDTGEKERQALIGEVARAAKGATRINTDVPERYEGLQSSQGSYTEMNQGGFHTFGDGLPPDSWQYKDKILQYAGAAEAFISKPDTEVRYKTEVVDEQVFGRFGRVKTNKKEQQVPDGEVPVMVVNPTTGQQELGVKVAYQFNGNWRGENTPSKANYEGPAYVTKSGRAGNKLFVEATLPKSIADKLQTEVAKNPALAREFAKQLTINNGISEEFWNDVVQPPYTKLPNDWEIAVADL